MNPATQQARMAKESFLQQELAIPRDLFTLLRPRGSRLPVVANLPHSGLQLSDEVADAFTPRQRRRLPNSDWHLQALYDFLPALGVTVLQANYSRYMVDLNRSTTPPLFGSFWSSALPEKTAFGDEIYLKKPSETAVAARVEHYYTPYHQALSTLLEETIAQHGRAYLLDLHSFGGVIEDEVCLGDARGKSCEEALTATVESGLTTQGFQVVRNRVFSGGYITRHYGALDHVDALQIELRYTSYLADEQLEIDGIPHAQGPRFHRARKQLQAAFEDILSALCPSSWTASGYGRSRRETASPALQGASAGDSAGASAGAGGHRS